MAGSDWYSDEQIANDMNNYQPINPIPTETVNAPAVISAGAASGAATGTAIAPGWGTAIGTIVGALMSWYGIKKQEEQSKSNLAYNEKMMGIELSEREKDRQIAQGQFKENLKLNKSQLAFQKSEAAKAWAWKEEDKNFTRTQAVADRLLNIFNSQPQLQQSFLNAAYTRKKNAYDFSSLNPIPR